MGSNLAKGKVFPVHSMQGRRGRRSKAPLVLITSAPPLGEWLTSQRFPFTPGKNSGPHRIAGCVGQSSGLDILEKRIVTWPQTGFKPSIVQPVAFRIFLLSVTSVKNFSKGSQCIYVYAQDIYDILPFLNYCLKYT